MGKTSELRKLITAQLNRTTGQTYHKVAKADATYPYKTYELKSVTFPDSLRDDLELLVDVWDRGPDYKRVEEIADYIEVLFNDINIPYGSIYPTFFRDNRYVIEDPDKTLQHIQLRFYIQLYEQEE